MRSVAISSIELCQDGRLAVRPNTTETELFEYIYRSATGVRWRMSDKAFVPAEPMTSSAAWWFGNIVSSVQSELGLVLRLDAATLWLAIPPDLHKEIESHDSPHAV